MFVVGVILFGTLPLLVSSFTGSRTSHAAFVVTRSGSHSCFRTIPHFGVSSSSSTPSSHSSTSPVAPDKVQIYPTATEVGAAVRQYVYQAAQTAIAERGSFALAIPGGSILKMLVSPPPEKEEASPDDNILSWTSHTTVVYVNHKCVSMEDKQLATHAKALDLFLRDWKDAQVVVLQGTSDGDYEATAYQTKMQTLSSLPRNEQGFPVFDLALIGVGDDGHIGSLYPGREEVFVDDPQQWVVPVAMKDPPSISLTLPVMASAKQVVVAACGVSDKYPQGKSDGMRRAIVDPTETLSTFPAVGLRNVATWVLDEAAASKLGDAYTSK